MRMQRGRRGRVPAAILALLALACASAPAPERRRRETAAAIPPPRSELAPLPVSEPDSDVRPAAVRLLDEQRFSLNVQDADLASVLLGLGRRSPLNLVVEPGVRGRVTANLQDVSLLEILDQIVLPRGFYYAVERNLLRIYPSDRQTRTYRIDYPNYTRKGASDLTIAGAISTKPEIGDAAAGASQDVSSAGVQTTQSTDFWTELEQGLREIVFGTGGEAGAAAAPEPGGEQGAGAPPGRRVLVSRQAALVTITAEARVLEQVERFLAEVARSTGQQVVIDAQIIEVTLRDELDLGLDVEVAPGLGDDTMGVFERLIVPGLREATVVQALAPVLTDGGFSFGFARDELGLVLKALARQTDVRVVSTPRITTLNNHKALIKVVRNEVFFIAEVEVTAFEAVGQTAVTQFTPQIVPVGVTLDVTPYVSQEGEITLHVHPSVSEVVDVVTQPSSDPDQPQVGSLPVIDLRETDTVLRVEDGQTIVIGGLIQSREFDQERKVPLLAEIPWLGQLFRNTSTEERRSELLVLLTPTTLDPPRIARVTEEALASLEETDALRNERLLQRPWWRRPYGQSYGYGANP